MSEKKLSNRIPANASQDWSTWPQPFVSDNGDIVTSVGKESLDKAESQRKTDAESIENVNVDRWASLKGMSAGQLQEIVENAERDGYSEGQKKGLANGQIEGYEAGRLKGLADMKEELLATQKIFEQLTQSLLEPLSSARESLDTLLLEIVTRLTRSVIRRELQLEPADIIVLINNALAVLPQKFLSVEIKLHSEDIVLVEEYAKQQQCNWNLVVDDSLLRGGLLIKTEQSTVDDTIEHRINEVLQQFLSKQNVDEQELENLSEPSLTNSTGVQKVDAADNEDESLNNE